MDQIKVRIKEKPKEYPILIGTSTSSLIKEFLEKNHHNKKIVVITDDNVRFICEKSIVRPLKHLSPYLISIGPGESSKSRQTKEKVEDLLLEKKYGRDTILLAVGGGVVGDLSGFIASTYNRGISLIHVPTTLLAMVDSSIGGKTGVNTKHGKNLIGTTYQPDAVFVGLNFLDTLPKEEFINGLAEIIKIAASLDKELFSFIEKNKEKIISKDKGALSHIIKRSIELKKEIVEKDEKEAGLRQILNFGHTFGHALESYKKYESKHGFCISIGLNVELKISELVNDLRSQNRQKIISLLKSVGLPTRVEKSIDSDKIIEIMKIDKKTRNQKPRFVILEKIGKIKSQNSNFSFEVDEETIKKAIEMCKK